MKSWETKNRIRIFKVVPNKSNSYLILKGEQSYLVDTGKATSYAKMLRNMESIGFSVKNLKYLLLTHTHYDHCQLARQIIGASNCKVVVSEKGAGAIAKGFTRVPNGTLFITSLIAKLGQAVWKSKFNYQAFEADVYVEAGSDFNALGGSIRLIETPGHTADSLSILIDEEIAIVGDAMFGVFRNSVFPPFANDVKAMVKSWGVLLDTECKLFLPGHGNAVSRSLLQKEYDKYSQRKL